MLRSTFVSPKLWYGCYIRAYAEILAANNYTVFIPDLFWREIPGYELNSNNDTDINKSLDLIRIYYLDKGFEDINMCLK